MPDFMSVRSPDELEMFNQKAAPKTDAGKVYGANPAPGGPNPMPQSTLRQELMKDIAQAGEVAQKTGSSLGISSEPPRKMKERGIMIGNKIAAQNDFNIALETQNKAVKDYVASAGYTDKFEVATAEAYMNDRFNAIRLDLIKKANAFNAKLLKEKASADERKAAARNFGTIAGAVAGSYFGPVGAVVGSQVGGTAGEFVGGQ